MLGCIQKHNPQNRKSLPLHRTAPQNRPSTAQAQQRNQNRKNMNPGTVAQSLLPPLPIDCMSAEISPAKNSIPFSPKQNRRCFSGGYIII
jgi:hypothetical protein